MIGAVVTDRHMQVLLWWMGFLIAGFGIVDRKPPLIWVGLAVIALGVTV